MNVLFYKIIVINYSQYINGGLQLHQQLDVIHMKMQEGAVMHVHATKTNPVIID